ncbi:RagB/SusD family nutrient uptake outer membrane protein [Mucilaginibacter glaciei]|uniref:RagB/SusD family nutrient uptake outer membrane protein n=1 Tax=Mucilaginibacter glaciei TaxID=2772109 RepID=A0A926NU71_9SPHI|nr:RagB/SusD family nutrient uptake outer membrane protein [Mucilaginibacter glaciei]MBD1395358.1 RagB/SusD family nutrient uptake outer membrane protein [Mucilaginibacter glaciei]
MKNIFIILAVLILFVSCKKASFLDDKSNNALNENSVFTDSVRTMSFLTRIYEDEGFAYVKTRWENGGQEQATDDSEFNLLNTARRPLILYTSSYSADSFPFFTEVWQTPFDNIRRVNLLLSKLPSTPLNVATQKRVAAEARFLRAWYYYNLLINFGGVPIVKDQVFTITDEVSIPRSTFAESVSYVVKELDEVSAILPVSYSGNDYGRVTKGAAMAVKAKLLLFAASPLFNGNTYPQPSTAEGIAAAGYPTFDVTRWKAAADAAQAIINSGAYALNIDNATAPGYGFYALFLKRINSEYIYFYNRVPNRDWEQFYLPVSRGNGSRNGTPTQTLVDAFPTSTGKAITDPTSGYNPQNPYINRDPRFNYSIIYNGAPYFLKAASAKSPVFTYVGAPTDGFTQSTSAAGPSGYFSRKMLDENLSADGPGNTDRGWGLIRYADILLCYAEAINEIGQTSQAYPVLRQIRERAGIVPGADNNYGMKTGMSQDEMREFIRNERHIELMYENTRWDDARRWKIAMKVFNGYNKLMKPTKVAVSATYPSGYNYEIVNSLFLHTFNEKNYLLPIPTSEIRKAPALVQNPGW